MKYQLFVDHVINGHAVSLIGMITELVRVLFISMEAIGLNQFKNALAMTRPVFDWFRTSPLRASIIVVLPVFVTGVLGVIVQSKLLVSLTIPSYVFVFIASFVLDYPTVPEKWVILHTKNGTIGPKGFVLITVGICFQLFGLLWEMAKA